MKKLILLFTLIALSVSAHTPTELIQEKTDRLESHAGRSLTDNEIYLIDYLHAGEYRVSRGVIKEIEFRGYVEMSNELAGTPVPQPALNLIYPLDEEGNPTVTNLPLNEFSMGAYDLGTNTIITLGASEKLDRRVRRGRITADDGATWLGFLGAYGFGKDDLMTMEQKIDRIKELIPEGE